jgi:hypothetical protein
VVPDRALQILTSYEASANGSTSAAVAVGVRPHVSLSVHYGTISTKVTAGKSFARRHIALQRFGGGSWHTVARRALNRHSAARFPTKLLPSGTSTIRVTISTNRAGAGYLGGVSPKRSFAANCGTDGPIARTPRPAGGEDEA